MPIGILLWVLSSYKIMVKLKFIVRDGFLVLRISEGKERYYKSGSYNIVVFLTICISYANNCFTL